MYKDFVDTIDHVSAEEMPAEALKLNGEYIENLMSSQYYSYRTLYAKGREPLSTSVSTFTTGVRDGSSILSRRYPERTITVGYFLKATSARYFQQAYNKLKSILDVQDAECIFYDEQDKYLTGTPSGLGDVTAGRLSVKGEFTILCADPFKYSVTEHEVTPTEDEGSTFVINYNGTYKSFPTLEADFLEESESDEGMEKDGDCGYVAWFNEDAKIIQLGDPEEEEGESYDMSQTLFSQSFKSTSAWTTTLNNIWTKNYNLYVGASSSTWGAMSGTPGFQPGYTGATEYYLTGTDFTRQSKKWVGASISRTIPADATGVVGATDWTVKWSQKLCIGNGSSYNNQRGGIQVIISGANDKVVAAANMFKGADDAGSKGQIWFHVNGSTVKKATGIDYSYRNERWGNNNDTFKSVKACSIVKSGTTVKFNLGGTVWSFTDSNIANLAATRITIVFLARNSYPVLTHQGVYEVTFTKDNCTTWVDIPNKFTVNDVAVADCATGTVLLNNAEAPEYGALGNDWESFYLQPGYNQIGFSYSDWCENPPTTKMRYREVYL